jgi:hypothetical protein
MFLDAPMQPDLSEARRLHAAGLKLVKLHNYTKQPIGIEWNKHSVTQIDDDATGYGLPLAVNGLCSLDPDHVDMARAGLAAWGFDLDELLAAGVRTSSTRPNSGGRSAFRADADGLCRWLTINVFDSKGKGTTVLELRAKSPNLQDVVPGVVYTGKGSPEVYSQHYAGANRFDNPPAVPEAFLKLWQELSTDDDKLREYSQRFVDGIVAAGYTVNGDVPTYRPPMGGGTKLAFQAKGVRTEYNEAVTVESILTRHGYTFHEVKQRWAHPGATGAPAIRPIPEKDGLWQSDHGGDPLHGTFDAWAAHVQLDHQGNTERAIVEWMWKGMDIVQPTIGGTGNNTPVVSFLDGGNQPVTVKDDTTPLQQLMDKLRVSEPEEAERIVPRILQVMESLPELQRVNWHKQVRDVMHWNVAEFKAILKDLREGWKTNPEAGFGDFDPYRYIYLAPRNEFYDIRSGMTLVPRGLDNKYINDTGEEPASRLLLLTVPPELSVADRLGWNPVSVAPPKREQIIYEDEGKRMVNTWRGFALSPIKGDVSLWLAHVEYLIPNQAERDSVLNWLAALVQRPASKPSFAIIHRGTARNGKDSLYAPLTMAMGDAAREVKIKDVIEGWGDNLFQRKFLIIPEVKRTQDRDASNEMKTIVAPTATGKRTLNLKGGQVVTQVDCMGVLMMTNYRSGFTIDKDDQRYFVVDSWVDPKDADYYRMLQQWYRAGGAAMVLNYLMQRDISQFNHNVLPFVTDGAREMAQASRYDYEQDLEDLVNEGLPPFDKGVVTSKALKAHCRMLNIRVGNNGLDTAMEQIGWRKVRGVKKVDGKTKATPTLYVATAEHGLMTPVDLYDLYERTVTTTLTPC